MSNDEWPRLVNVCSSRSSGKGRLMAKIRDLLLRSGKTVHVASMVNGEPHICAIKPFRRPKP